MSQKAGMLNLVQVVGGSESRGRRQRLVVGLIAMVLVVAAIISMVFAVRLDVSSGVAAGIEASSARWVALGGAYGPDYEASADASSARWSAMGEWYRSRVASGQ